MYMKGSSKTKWIQIVFFCTLLVTGMIVLAISHHFKETNKLIRLHPVAHPSTHTNTTSISSHILAQLKVQENGLLDEGCSCPKGRYSIRSQNLPKETLNVRNDAYRKWKEREEKLRVTLPVALCPASFPLQFVSSGIVIEPMQSTTLFGLSLTSSALDSVSHSEDVRMIFRLMRGLGHISLHCSLDVHLDGNDTAKMALLVNSKNAEMLRRIKYKSTVDVISDWETISVLFMGHELNIHIQIRRQPLPYLYRTSSVSPPIHERVTIVTKTFERYEQINRLIDSISKFYPNMSIIIADDSVHFQTINRTNVFHYKMPAQMGWFAGRNLGLSQVMTEYFVWVDDDFVFTDKTKLELFLEKLDKVELALDIVAGLVGSKATCDGTCVKVGRHKDGYCITIKGGCDHGRVPGYPQCIRADRVTNFFMARTRSVQRIGFDPHFDHVGHIEFFMDGYHTLRSICCPDVQVDHVRGGSQFYKKNRNISGGLRKAHVDYVLYKYHSKCQTFV
jgi:(N-acetylneuraminyl)-galactosylglucosylceramide N-acetylgalactosaminyltransferase